MVEAITDKLVGCSHRWLVTGGAGFIGSNLVEHLLRLNQHVVVIDNFSSGHKSNLDEVRDLVGPEVWGKNFSLIKGDVCDPPTLERALIGVDFVLHQAAVGSVPRSMEDPLYSNENNVNGALAVFFAAKTAGVKRVVYASSSSVYGDSSLEPKVENMLGRPLSPYAITKRVNEIYAEMFNRVYGISTVGLRYFNVFGPRQDPLGPYSAVVPLWFKALLRKEPVYINGDGSTSRDFCYVENVVQANLLAALTDRDEISGKVFNVAFGEKTTLNELFGYLKECVGGSSAATPMYRDFRPGDIRHSLGDISEARRIFGYNPEFDVKGGLRESAKWYDRYFNTRTFS